MKVARNEHGDRFITVYKNMLLPSVEIVKAALENEDILCNTKGYDPSGETFIFGAEIKIQVPKKDRARAEKIIKELSIINK